MTPLATMTSALVAGLATGVGALPVLARRPPSAIAEARATGFAAGVMLAASAVSLLVPAMEMARARHGGGAGGLVVTLGLLAGVAALARVRRHGPDEAVLGDGTLIRRRLMLVLAVALHNLPEGLAVGAAGGTEGGLALATGITLQNLPEGWIVAAALAGAGWRPGAAVLGSLATGLLEPVAALVGVALAYPSQLLVAPGMAFAAGAMLDVVAHEVLPELAAHERPEAGAPALVAGFAAMVGLDVLLG